MNSPCTPWEIGKAFDRSAPIGLVRTVEQVGHPANGRVELKINGDVQQEGDLNQMIWKVPEMISYLSEYFEMAAGDVILSGTPSGVGPVSTGGVMELHIDGLVPMPVKMVLQPDRFGHRSRGLQISAICWKTSVRVCIRRSMVFLVHTFMSHRGQEEENVI